MTVRFHPSLEDLMVPRDSIQMHPENANNGDVDEIIASILSVGCYRPSYYSAKTGYILAGNNLYAALVELGCLMVPAMPVHVTPEQEDRILVGDNAIARRAKTDDAALLRLLDRIEDTEIGLIGIGFDQRQKDDLRNLVNIQSHAPLSLGGEGGIERLLHTIVCPECGHEWTRGGNKDAD